MTRFIRQPKNPKNRAAVIRMMSLKITRLFGCVFMLVLALGHGQAFSDQFSSSPALPQVPVHTDSDGRAVFDDHDLQYPGHAGEPAMPYQIIRLLLPSDTDMASVNVSVNAYESEPLSGQWRVRPIAPPAVWDGEQHVVDWPAQKHIVDGKDMAIYSNNQQFPASWIGHIVTGSIRHWKLVEVPIALFQYNPVTQTLFRLTAIEIGASFNRRTSVTDHASPPSIHHDASAKRARQLTLNYDDIVSSDPFFSSRSSASPAAPPTYAIITTRAIADQSGELTNFIRHKQQRGFNVQVVTEDVWGGGVGDTAAENIRHWLKTNYQDQNIDYVLLIGNPHPASGDIPMKMLWPRHNATTHQNSPSDYYYADLTGNWDADGDGFYGEWGDDFGANGVDRYWEVCVGRIPTDDDMDNLDNILAKIVDYQNETEETAKWRKQVLLPMKPLDRYTFGYHLGEAIKDTVLSAQQDWQYHRIYDDDYDLTPPPESVPCTVDTVSATWNAIRPGAVFWLTHGVSKFALDIMDITHAATLDDHYPAFIFQGSCSNAYPEDAPNLNDALLKNGAIATISASRVSWYIIGQSDFAGSPSLPGMAYEYAKRLIMEEMGYALALNNLKESLSVYGSTVWMNYTVMNLYGDPETGLAVKDDDMIIDNGDSETSESGLWTPCDARHPYNDDAMCTTEPDARYTYQLPLEGLYAVDLWWTGQNDSCNDVSVHIYDGDTYLDTIRIDQHQHSGQWNLLDAFAFSDTARVGISATDGCTTSADAVRFRPRNVLFVDSGKTSSGDGSSWSEAFQSIQEAVDAASANSEIWVKKGRYPLSAQIEINKAVYLYGGFQGHESDRRDRQWKQHATMIDGDGKVPCMNVVADATIDGFVIANGYASEASGGMLIDNGASARVDNVTFFRNNGGGVWNGSNCASVFHNCAFIENEANQGGAIYNEYDLTISKSRFVRNRAHDVGGGIYNRTEASSARIDNCIFTDNANGAIVNNTNQLSIANCTIVGNQDFGISNHNAQPTVSNTILWNNQIDIQDHGPGSLSISYSNIDQDGYAGNNGNIRQNPQFISMADADFRLSAISPCIDSGSNTIAARITADLENGPRIIDGDGDGNAIVDMGALEAFITTTGNSIGIRLVDGTRITQCSPVDPVTIEALRNRPDHLTQGLIRFSARVHEPGAQAAYRMILPQPIPQNQKWFFYSADLGWIDFSRETISGNSGDGAQVNDDRSEVTIYVTDNGPYDDDPAAGIVADPTGPATPGVPDLFMNPGTVNFGTVQIGETALQSLVITNQGTVTLAIGKISITGADASEFEIVTDACSENSFAYSESGTVGIRFSPTRPGPKTAAVTIESNDPDAAVIDAPLTATSVEPPADTSDKRKHGGGGGSGCFIDAMAARRVEA